MLTVSNSKASSKADETRQDGQKVRGNKGRKELYVKRLGSDSFAVQVNDYGNFGKLRWYIDFGELSTADVEAMRQLLDDLIEGRTDSTHVKFEPEVEVETEADASADTASATVDTTDAGVESEASADSMDELTA